MNEFISDKVIFLTWGRLNHKVRTERLIIGAATSCMCFIYAALEGIEPFHKKYRNFESVIEYLAKIWIHIAYTSFWIPAYSTPAPLLYMLIDMACFFGCQQFSFAATITLRILCILHDFSYGVTNAVLTDYYSGRNDCGYGCDPGRSPNIKLIF